MNKKPMWPLAAIVGAVLLLGSQGKGCKPSITPVGPPPSGPDMVAIFKKSDNALEARAHAHAMATICTAFADAVEYDGSLPAANRRFDRGVQLDDFRLGLRQTRMKGWSFASKYPDIVPAFENYLASTLGTAGGKIDDAQRQKWVQSYRALAACCEYASKTL